MIKGVKELITVLYKVKNSYLNVSDPDLIPYVYNQYEGLLAAGDLIVLPFDVQLRKSDTSTYLRASACVAIMCPQPHLPA